MIGLNLFIGIAYFMSFFINDCVPQNCSFPSILTGTWTTTYSTFGALTFTTDQMSTESALSTITEYNCTYTKDSNTYILKSSTTFTAFGDQYHVWLCLELRQSSDYAYYFYFNSEPESFLNYVRAEGFRVTENVLIENVCSEEAPATEFYTMIKQGNETEATEALQNPTALYGIFSYIYEDSATSVNCTVNNTANIDGCQNNTHLYVNSTGCGATPFASSTSGLLGSIVSFQYDTSDSYFLVLYNTDSGASNPFFCTVFKSVNDTVFMSVVPTNCESGQTATSLPSTPGSFLLELYLSETCKNQQLT